MLCAGPNSILQISILCNKIRLVISLMILMIKMMVTRSRNTRDPIPVSSSLPGGLMTMEEMFQMVTTNNANIRPSVLLDV